MRRRIISGILLVLPILGVLRGFAANGPASESSHSERRKRDRASVLQAQSDRSGRQWPRLADGERGDAPDFGTPQLIESRIAQPKFASGNTPPPPPASPGLAIAHTSYDYQHNTSQGYQIARVSGADLVHFVWMAWDRLPQSVFENDRYVAYGSYTISTSTLNQGYGGFFVGLSAEARAGYINLDVDASNAAYASCHQREDPTFPYGPWHLNFPVPGGSLHTDDALTGHETPECDEVTWPRNACSRDSDTKHLVAHTTPSCEPSLMWYWRHNGTDWTGPVVLDTTHLVLLGYVIADDNGSDKVAVVTHESGYLWMNGANNIAYYESTTDGAGWITGSEPKVENVITNYNDALGTQAYAHISTTYDNDGVLNVAFDELMGSVETPNVAIRHWNSSRGTVRPVAIGGWPAPEIEPTETWDLTLTKLTMGIGDGGTMCQGGATTNNNYVYILYTQLSGPSQGEQEDFSALGHYNGELYLSVSTSGGNTWSPPVNLTNTRTPGCNPGPADTITGLPANPNNVCRSENWATIGRVVSDIDILFISDLDAGGVALGEGTWQLNPVHYLRIPGGTTNAPIVCPIVAPNLSVSLSSDASCEYHAPTSGSNMEELAIFNLGNSTLTGTLTIVDFPGLPSLSVSGGSSLSIPEAAPEVLKTVTMSGNNCPEGLYHASIQISHNDATKPNPYVIPIDFFVFDEFFCPDDDVLKTGVTSPGSLALQVETSGRFASQNDEGGLWRHADSSRSIFDASLLIAHGEQDADTTVFIRAYSRQSNGQFGYRVQGELEIDTAAYGTGTGCARASTSLSTRDSVVGINVEWVFPQDAAMDDMVLLRYEVFRYDDAVPVNDLVVGVFVDLDVMPARRLGTIQNLGNNISSFDASRDLIWLTGADTLGHLEGGQNTATRFRAGIAMPGSYIGAVTVQNSTEIYTQGGPSDGYLYSTMMDASGLETASATAEDQYVLVTLARQASLAAGDTLTFVLVLASDTVDEAAFLETVDKGILLGGSSDLCTPCSCPCQADPQCDGVLSNVQDVVLTVNVAFRGASPAFDLGCPRERTDVDANGVTSVTDVVKVVNVAFRGQSASANYGDACP